MGHIGRSFLKRFLGDLSIRKKYFFFSGISMLIVVMFFSITTYYSLRNDNLKKAILETQSYNSQLSRTFESILSNGITTSKMVVPNSLVQNYLSSPGGMHAQESRTLVKSFLAGIEEPYSNIDSLIIYSLDGQVVCSAKAVPFSGYADESALQEIAEQLTKDWGGTIYTETERVGKDGTPVKYLSILKPIYLAASGKLAGFLEINYGVETLLAFLSGPEPRDQNHFLLIDGDGNILMNNAPDTPSPSKAELLDQTMSSTVARLSIGKFLIQRSSIGKTGWSLLCLTPFSQINEQATHQMPVLIVFVFVSIVLSILFAIIFSNLLTKPILNLNESMEKVGRGDLTVRVDVRSQDEIGKMGLQFNRMLTRMSALINQITREKLARRESQLLALQAQINPHFLYNTLASISTLISIGMDEEAQDMIRELEIFYKTSLSGGENVIPLRNELQNVENYIKIVRFRYDNSFEYSIECPEELMDYKITKLTLQPIVENSIHHGFRQHLVPGDLNIRAEKQGDDLVIRIRDNGPGIPAGTEQKIKTRSNAGYGLFNVDERIKLYFGQEYGVSIDRTCTEGACIVVRLPAIFESREMKLQMNREESDDQSAVG